MVNLEKDIRWYHRLNEEVYNLIIVNTVILIIDYKFFIKFFGMIELVTLIFIMLSMFRKEGRIVYKVKFDDSKKRIDIHYCQFIIKNFVVYIPYSQSNYRYHLKSYGMGNVMNALIFLRSKKTIAEITEKNRVGWTKNEIAKIINKLKLINNERNSQI